MNKIKRSIAAGALVLATALTGCANDPTNLATVNGQVVKADAIDPTVEALLAHQDPMRPMTRGEATTIASQSAVIRQGLGDIYAHAGQKLDMKVVDEVLVKAREASTGMNREILTDARLTPLLETQAAVQILQEKVGPDKTQEALRSLDVTLNPRFGVWDLSKMPEEGAGSLSRLWQRAGSDLAKR